MKLPRFMLRDLFWLILVAAILFAWARDQWVDSARGWEQLMMDRGELAEERESLGYTIEYTEEGIEIIRPASDVEQAMPAPSK